MNNASEPLHAAARAAASLEYARPMPPVRVRQVLPRSLAMTLMICGTFLTASPCLAIAWGALARDSMRTQDFETFVLALTGLFGVAVLGLSVYLSPRVPRTGD